MSRPTHRTSHRTPPRRTRRWAALLCAALLQAGATQAADSGPVPLTRLSLGEIGGWIELPVDVNGQRGRWLIDTGSSRHIVSAAFAQRHGLAERARVRADTALGPVQGVEVALPALQIGAHTHAGQTALRLDDLGARVGPAGAGLDGILGVPLLAGVSLGREGPSVQIAAGVMHHARRWLPSRSQVSEHGLLLAGGAAGIAAAFYTPLGGVMFAIEELTRKPEQRSNGLLLSAIVLAGLMAVSVYGNATYFGVIRVENLSMALLLPGLLVAVCCGVAGGLFSRLLVISLAGTSADWFSRFRRRAPVRFAAMCGLAVAVLGVVSQGDTYGSGYTHTRDMLESNGDASPFYVLLKFMATWITAWAGVGAGVGLGPDGGGRRGGHGCGGSRFNIANRRGQVYRIGGQGRTDWR